MDVFHYHREHPDFPHESTADQWFSESQFESYRALGVHCIEEICEDMPVRGLRNFLRQVQSYVTSAAPQRAAVPNGPGHSRKQKK